MISQTDRRMRPGPAVSRAGEGHGVSATPVGRSYSRRTRFRPSGCSLLIVAADVDWDGDLDALFLSTQDNTIARYENTAGAGTGGVWIVIHRRLESALSGMSRARGVTRKIGTILIALVAAALEGNV